MIITFKNKNGAKTTAICPIVALTNWCYNNKINTSNKIDFIIFCSSFIERKYGHSDIEDYNHDAYDDKTLAIVLLNQLGREDEIIDLNIAENDENGDLVAS